MTVVNLLRSELTNSTCLQIPELDTTGGVPLELIVGPPLLLESLEKLTSITTSHLFVPPRIIFALHACTNH